MSVFNKKYKSKKPWGLILVYFSCLMLASYLFFFILIDKAEDNKSVLPQPFTAISSEYGLKDIEFQKLENKEKYSLNDFKDKPIIINFWATWCPPCLKELPSFEGLAQREDMYVLPISLDQFKSKEEVQAFISKKLSIDDLDLYFDHTEEINRLLKPKGLPLTFLLNKKSEIVGEYYGDYNWKDFSYSLNKESNSP